MLQNMFVGQPPGNYDRLLDFSRAVTGSLFFVPAATFLENISTDGPASPAIGTSPISPISGTPAVPGVRETSLRIGSLKEEKDE
jgi:putative iron-dependent peroxidase